MIAIVGIASNGITGASVGDEPDLGAAVHRLLEAARLQSDELQDDVSVILCRTDASQ